MSQDDLSILKYQQFTPRLSIFCVSCQKRGRLAESMNGDRINGDKDGGVKRNLTLACACVCVRAPKSATGKCPPGCCGNGDLRKRSLIFRCKTRVGGNQLGKSEVALRRYSLEDPGNCGIYGSAFVL